MIGGLRLAFRVLALVLAFNAGAGHALDLGDVVPVAIGAAVGIIAVDFGFDLAAAAERRRLARWAQRGLDHHQHTMAARARATRAGHVRLVPNPPGDPDVR